MSIFEEYGVFKDGSFGSKENITEMKTADLV